MPVSPSLLLWSVARAAEPADDAWWVGLPLADVVLVAPEGGLPDESLEGLLRASQGEPCDPKILRLDLATLFQIGEFSGVQADVEPWVVFDEAGEVQEGVLLTYQVWPAPRVAKVEVTGGGPIPERELLEALAIHRGQAFYPEVDVPLLEQRMERWLARQGYPDGEVALRSTEPEPGRLYVVADVSPGVPDTIDRLTFAGDIEGVVTREQLARWARKAGMEEGEPLAPESVARVQDALRENLGRVQGNLFRASRGYIAARVTPAIVRGPFEEPDGSMTEGVRVTWAIEPGPKLELDVRGMGWNGRRKAMAALDVDHRLRVTRGWLDQAPDRMVAALQDRGYHEATATVTMLRPDEDTQRLVVEVDRGPRHLIGGTPASLTFLDFAFAWGEGAPERKRDRLREEKALQSVFDQSSTDVLRRDVYSERAMVEGLDAARQFYAGRGHLDPTIELLEAEMYPRRTIGNLFRTAAGYEPRIKVVPRVSVAPGPVTTLEELTVQGGADDVPLPFLDEARAERVGEPYSPQALDALAQRVVEAHRAAGYLEADARVQTTEPAPLTRTAMVVVDPGTQLLLRSVVVRGMQVTRPAFAQKQVDLPLGQPVTSEALEEVRSELYDLGVFQTVSLDLLGDEQARDLVVSLRERRRTALEGAVGLSTDQGIRTYGRVTRRNLWGLAHRVELYGQLGLQYRSEDIRDWLPNVTNPEWRAAVSYTAPQFPLRRQDLVLDVVLRERVQRRTWTLDSTGGGAAVETNLPHTRLRGGVRLEARQLNEIDTATLLEGEPWSLLLAEDPTVPTRSRLQESVTALIVEDLRDDPVSPTKGAWLSANAELAPGVEWPDQPTTSFVKGEARLSGYVPVGRFTLHVGLGGGAVRTLGGGVVPLEDRFRLGGTNSIRGYVRDAIGPHNQAARVSVDWPAGLQPAIDYLLRDDPDRWSPTGGDTMASGTVELTMPLPALGFTSWEGYSASLFADAGNVWLLDPNLAVPATTDLPEWADALPDLRFGVGAGMRVATPVGPVRLDVGFNPQRIGASGEVLELLRDELEEPSVRAHLTLGATW